MPLKGAKAHYITSATKTASCQLTKPHSNGNSVLNPYLSVRFPTALPPGGHRFQGPAGSPSSIPRSFNRE